MENSVKWSCCTLTYHDNLHYYTNINIKCNEHTWYCNFILMKCIYLCCTPKVLFYFFVQYDHHSLLAHYQTKDMWILIISGAGFFLLCVLEHVYFMQALFTLSIKVSNAWRNVKMWRHPLKGKTKTIPNLNRKRNKMHLSVSNLSNNTINQSRLSDNDSSNLN